MKVRDDERSAVRGLARIVAGLAALGLAGTLVDLLLITHYEGWGQQVPLVILPLPAGLLAWAAVTGRVRYPAALRLALWVSAGTGFAGIGLHLYGSWAFQQEIDPSGGVFARAIASLRAHSPPSLAPGQMSLLSLFGLTAIHGASGWHMSQRRSKGVS
jgi:hypothetical protein